MCQARTVALIAEQEECARHSEMALQNSHP